MSSLPLPTNYTLAAGAALGRTRLTAFDNALLAAGVGNLNLVRVSSVLPAGAAYRDKCDLPAGSLCPIAYGSVASGVAGQLLSAAVAVGLRRGSFGMIMEFSGECAKAEAERVVREMVEEAFANRDTPLDEVRVKAVQITVPEGKVACALAAVPLWG